MFADDMTLEERMEAATRRNEAEAAEWPEPIRLDAPKLPGIKAEWVPGWAGSFVGALARATETPLELPFAMVLAAASAAVAGKASVMVSKGYFEPLNLWTVCALPPGNRKSSIENEACKPLREWEGEQREILAPEIKRIQSERKTMEAHVKSLRDKAAKADRQKAGELAREVADLEANLPDEPIPPKLWTSDCTPERLGALLADHGERMAWISSEGGLFEMLAGRYSNGIPNLDLMLKAHSGDPDRVDRGSRPPVDLRHPLLTIGMTVQPDVLRGLATKPGFRGRGLLGRFLYLIPPSMVGYRTLDTEPVPAFVSANYSAGIRALLDLQPAKDERGRDRPHTISLSDDAHALRRDHARDIEHAMRPEGRLEHAADWGGKAPGAAARLAGVLHCIEHAHGRPWDVHVSGPTMMMALEIMEVIEAHTLAALDMMGSDPNIAAARTVWRWIKSGRRERFAVRDCFNALRGTFQRVDGLRAALDVLAERGYLRINEAPREGAGRPASPTVVVSPVVLAGWR